MGSGPRCKFLSPCYNEFFLDPVSHNDTIEPNPSKFLPFAHQWCLQVDQVEGRRHLDTNHYSPSSKTFEPLDSLILSYKLSRKKQHHLAQNRRDYKNHHFLYKIFHPLVDQSL
jgi:hypothetical protein